MTFVPHQDRHPLHGITVVLETTGTQTYVGRLDTADHRGVCLKDVGLHDASGTSVAKSEYLRQTLSFGVRKEHDQVLIEPDRVRSITPLGELGL